MAWRNARLGSVARLVDRSEAIEPTKEYRQAGVRLWGSGAYQRDTILGSQTKYPKLSKLKRDDIIVNKIWARNGSVSVVIEELGGAYASPEFPLYEIDTSHLLPRFFYWFCKCKILWEQCDMLSRGTSGQNRLKPADFLNIEIPLPFLDEQRAIVQRLDAVQAKLQERQQVLDTVEREMQAMLFNAFQKIAGDAEYMRLSEVAPLNRRPVDIEPNVEYPELGARSFGRGLFHKPSVLGSEITWQKLFRVHSGDLVFSNIKAWEGAFGIAGENDHMRVGSHRYLTCTPNLDLALPIVLWFYLQSHEGMTKIGEASPGSADRNRTLGQKALMSISVPVPSIDAQRRFAQLHSHIELARSIRSESASDMEALIPAMLHEIFEKQRSTAKPTSATVIPFEKPAIGKGHHNFREAVLVGAIVRAFASENGQPIGNFRLQKGVYFARRYTGEHALTGYLRKAAGPYNPSMRYAGGIKIATDKGWIERKRGKFGEGSTLGAQAAEMDEWIEKYDFGPAAAWVRDNFQYKRNDLWETLATIDYAMLALEADGAYATPAAILSYIEADDEWRPKLEKLGLTEALVQSNIAELQNLFPVRPGNADD